jgi:hypothetical protein
VAQPIFDKLRQRRRDALVAWIMHTDGFDSSALTSPVFYQDDHHIFHIEPALTETATATSTVACDRTLCCERWRGALRPSDGTGPRKSLHFAGHLPPFAAEPSLAGLRDSLRENRHYVFAVRRALRLSRLSAPAPDRSPEGATGVAR